MCVMHVRADFSRKAVLRPSEAVWVPSPQPGVSRCMLDRIGGEVARATSLVRFAPGSGFPFHVHGGGEEILVLDGTLVDEHGVYPAGTYLRDPVGSSHAPHTETGCTLFVKLWQVAPDDRQRLVIATRSQPWMRVGVDGMAAMPLHAFEGESSYLMRLAPGLQLGRNLHPGGEEILVLQGCFCDEDGVYPAGSWLRSPVGSWHTPYTLAAQADQAADDGGAGCLLFVKQGHLLPPLRLPAGEDAQPSCPVQAR
jgi:anti-sigma factor ChrR (cupin superfamily)